MDHGPRDSAHRVVELAPDRPRVASRAASPRISPRRGPRVRPAVARSARASAASVLGEEAGADPPVGAGGDAAGVEDARAPSSGSGAIVAPPPHGARTTKPPTRPVVALEAAASSPGAANAAQQVGAILAGGGGVEGGHRGEVGRRRNGRTRGSGTPAAPGARPAASRIRYVRLDLEAEPLVQRPAGVGRDEHERPAAGGLGRLDDRLGQGPAEAPAAPGRVDEDRPDPADRPVDRRDAGADDRRRRRRPRTARHAGMAAATKPNLTRRSPQSPRRTASAAGSTSAGSSAGSRAAASSDRSAALGYHRAVATLSRADVEHVAHLARLGLTRRGADAARGPAQPHPRPVRDPGRAADRRHPADGPDDRAREHPARGRACGRRCRSRPSSPTRRRATATSSSCRRSSTSADASMTDLDAPPRPRDGRAPARRRGLVARADRGPPRPPPSARTARSTPG